jgi:hypothetical protein
MAEIHPIQRMNKRLLLRLIKERAPGIRHSGTYFFRADFEWVLQGFVLEYVPRGVYIWDFVFPLFDLSDVNLLYSERLQQRPFVAKGEMAEEDLADLVLTSPEVVAKLHVNQSMSVREFGQYLLRSNAFLNAHGKLVYGASLVLNGEPEAAAAMLDEIRALLHPSDIESWECLRARLSKAPAAAISFLEQRRRENLAALGMPASPVR